MSFGRWLGLIDLVASLLLIWSLREPLLLVFAAVVLPMALCTLVAPCAGDSIAPAPSPC